MRRLLLCLLASGLPIACSAAPPDNGKAVQSERWAMPVKHDANLYRIDDKLYRSEQPVAEDGEAIHCYHGADRTGLIAGMYRIIYQGWSVEEAKAEMQHGPYGYHSIWKNIANLFTEEKVKQVKTQLKALRKRG